MRYFKPVHVVTMVLAVCAAAVLTPVAVSAATGTLVNIVDPGNASRQARVSSAGTLTVESRAGSVAHSFTMNGSRLGLGYINLVSVNAPTRIAVTELTITGQGPSGSQDVLLEAYVRTSGSAGCTGPGSPGYTRHTLRRLSFANGSSIQQLFNGPPLVIPAGAAGQPTCFGVTVISIPSGSATYVSGIAYRL